MTARKVIKKSLGLIGAIGPGEGVDGDEASDLLESLNLMLDGWATEPFTIYADTLVTHTLTDGVASYTIGSGGDIDATRPMAIKSAYFTEGDISYDLAIIDEIQYSHIGNKPLEGQYPKYLYYEPDYPLGNIILHPVPGAGLTLNMYTQVPFTQFASLNAAVNFPPGYERALVYNFACEIAGTYGTSPTQQQAKIAKKSLHNIKRQNLASDNMEASFSSALPRSIGNHYRVESDTYR